MAAKFGTLNWMDVLKGAGIAALTSILTALMTFLNNGTFPTTWAEWQFYVYAAIGCFVAYVLKNLLTNSQGEVLKGEQDKPIN